MSKNLGQQRMSDEQGALQKVAENWTLALDIADTTVTCYRSSDGTFHFVAPDGRVDSETWGEVYDSIPPMLKEFAWDLI